MRGLDPDVERELEELDAAVAGLGSDPQLDLIVASVREQAPPPPSPDFVAALGERVAAGFPRAKRRRMPGRPRLVAAGAVAALAAAAVALVVAGQHQGGVSSSSDTLAARSAPTLTTAPPAAAGPAQQAAESSAASPYRPAPPTPAAPAGQPRQVEQDATLALLAPRGQTQQVADRVVQVTDGAGGIVSNSNVTTGSQATAQASFQLLIPSQRLSATLAALSNLAPVASRTQNTNDVTDQYAQAERRLQDARSEREALLRQLAQATPAGQIASLRYQLGLVRGEINSAAASLASLQQKVNYSSVNVTISESAGAAVGGTSVISGGMSDALDVLETSLAVAVVTLAACVPLGLAAIVLWWLRELVLRRRREQALAG